MPIATHELSLHGVSGAVFWCILSAVIFYVIGFATVGWESFQTASQGWGWVGLWTTCINNPADGYSDQPWFRATQAMITIGLILLVISWMVAFVYMFVHSLSINKNAVIITFCVLAFAAVIFMLIGFIIFGSKHNNTINWSYAFCVIGAILCFAAGILGIVQMKQSNVF